MVGKHFGSKTKNVLLAIHVYVHLHLPSAKKLFQMVTPFLPSLMTALQTFLPTSHQPSLPTSHQTSLPTSHQPSLPTSHQTSLPTSHQTSSTQPSQLIFHFLCPLFYCISLPMKSKRIKEKYILSLLKNDQGF